MSNEFEYELLSDEPILPRNEEKIRFGHKEIAKVLSELIIKADPPFTLGLFGKWGTGKSTIIGLLENILKKTDITPVLFDVWKYQGDSLRRQFLINIDEELKLELHYKDTLNQSLTKPLSLSVWEQIKFQFKNIWGKIFFLIIIFLIIFIPIQFFDLSLVMKNWMPEKIFDKLYDFSLLLVILNFLLKSVQSVSGTTQIMRTDSAEGFEELFNNEVLDAVKDKKKADKLLIIIDNLDRASHDSAVQMLKDIKTFLSSKERKNLKVIFLIACDDNAIKKHLESCKFDNPDEFLRKFFNASVNIPKYLGLELDEYTSELIEETKIDAFRSNDINWLITSSFRGNPREIKQFINTLTAQYLLAREMEDSENIMTPGLITKYPQGLAKLIIIKQKFPTIYGFLEEKVISEGILSLDEIKEDYEFIPGIEKKLEVEKLNSANWIEENVNFNKFLISSAHIEINQLPTFIGLKQSKTEKQLRNWDLFRINADDKNIVESSRMFNSFTKDNLLQEFDSIAHNYIVSNMKKSERKSESSIWPFLSTLIRVGKSDLHSLKKVLIDIPKCFPGEGKLRSRLDDFPPQDVFGFLLPALPEKQRSLITDLFIKAITVTDSAGKSNYPQEKAIIFIKVLLKNQNLIKDFSKIKGWIENNYCNHDFLQIFGSENQSNFVSDMAIDHFVDTINVQDLENDEYTRKFSILRTFDINNTENVLKKFRELFDYEKGIPARIQRVQLVNFITDFIQGFSEKIKLLQSDDVPYLAMEIKNWYCQESNWESGIKYCCLKAILLMKNVGLGPVVELNHAIADFIQHSPLNERKKLQKTIIENLVNQFPTEFENAVCREIDVYEYGKKGFPEDQNASLISNILDALSAKEASEKQKYYELIFKLKNFASPELVSRFHNELLSSKEALPKVVSYYARKRGLFNFAQKSQLLIN